MWWWCGSSGDGRRSTHRRRLGAGGRARFDWLRRRWRAGALAERLRAGAGTTRPLKRTRTGARLLTGSQPPSSAGQTHRTLPPAPSLGLCCARGSTLTRARLWMCLGSCLPMTPSHAVALCKGRRGGVRAVSLASRGGWAPSGRGSACASPQDGHLSERAPASEFVSVSVRRPFAEGTGARAPAQPVEPSAHLPA